MQTISKDETGRLVFRVRSPMQNAVGGLGVLFLVWLVIHLWIHHPNRDRTIGLIGASVTCLLFLLVSETGDFVFDAGTRRLTWSRRMGFIRRSGSVPFEEIRDVVIRTALGSDRIAPGQRIVLLTRHGELPMSIGYTPSDEHAPNAETVHSYLDLSDRQPLQASVDDLVATGRDLDAIRELRLARGISLEEARTEVNRIRSRIKRDGS